MSVLARSVAGVLMSAVAVSGVYGLHVMDKACMAEQKTISMICRSRSDIADTAFMTAYEIDKPAEEPMTTEELIIRESEAAGIDPKVAVAISRLETGHWTSYAYVYCNNVGGLSDNEVPRTYPTVEDGVKAFVECLVTYWEKGLTVPELIEPVYCPPSNGRWAANVRAIMEEFREIEEARNDKETKTESENK